MHLRPGCDHQPERRQIDDLRAHYDWDSGGRLSFLVDGSYGRISDDNSRQSAHGLVSFRLFKEPFVAIKGEDHSSRPRRSQISPLPRGEEEITFAFARRER